MSNFEVNPEDPYVYSPKLAARIAAVLEEKAGIKFDDPSKLLEAIPELKHIDKALTAIETVWNDCQLAKQELTDMEGENLEESMETLADAFREITGEDPREYGVTWDRESGEPGDEDEDDSGEGD